MDRIGFDATKDPFTCKFNISFLLLIYFCSGEDRSPRVKCRITQNGRIGEVGGVSGRDCIAWLFGQSLIVEMAGGIVKNCIYGFNL